MGGFFGAVSKRDCILDVFFGTDYHSHLGTHRGGMAVLEPGGKFLRAIHNIQNAPFRTKFEQDFAHFRGHVGLGVISDTDPQPLVMESHLGVFALNAGQVGLGEAVVLLGLGLPLMCSLSRKTFFREFVEKVNS